MPTVDEKHPRTTAEDRGKEPRIFPTAKKLSGKGQEILYSRFFRDNFPIGKMSYDNFPSDRNSSRSVPVPILISRPIERERALLNSYPGQEFSIQLTIGRENFPIRADRREIFPDNAKEQRNFPDRKFPDFQNGGFEVEFLSPYLRSTISDRVHIWTKCSWVLGASTVKRNIWGDARIGRHIDSKIVFSMEPYGTFFRFLSVQKSNGENCKFIIFSTNVSGSQSNFLATVQASSCPPQMPYCTKN